MEKLALVVGMERLCNLDMYYQVMLTYSVSYSVAEFEQIAIILRYATY